MGIDRLRDLQCEPSSQARDIPLTRVHCSPRACTCRSCPCAPRQTPTHAGRTLSYYSGLTSRVRPARYASSCAATAAAPCAASSSSRCVCRQPASPQPTQCRHEGTRALRVHRARVPGRNHLRGAPPAGRADAGGERLRRCVCCVPCPRRDTEQVAVTVSAIAAMRMQRKLVKYNDNDGSDATLPSGMSAAGRQPRTRSTPIAVSVDIIHRGDDLHLSGKIPG